MSRRPPAPRPSLGLALLLAAAGCSSTVTVSGLAIGNDLQPVAGAQVVVTSGSFSATATTDSAGAFSVAGVPTPYDAMLVVTDLSEVTLYQGLSRADPTLVSLGSSVPSHPSATLAGTIDGGVAVPLPPNHRTRVSFGSAEGGGVASADGASGAYQLKPSWWGSPTTTGALFALQWQYDASGRPLAYTGFASRSGVTLSDGSTVSGQDLTLGPVGPSAISGSLALPSGYTSVNRQLYLVFGPNQALDLLSESVTSPAFDYVTPGVSGASLLLVARAASASASSTAFQPLATQASAVQVQLPAAATLASPAAGAVGVGLGTAFTWSPAPGGISLLVVRGPSTYVVVTSGDATTLPDAAAQGLGLPSDADFVWYVFGLAPFADLDAAAGAGGYLGPFVQPTSPLSQTQSVTRTLTTAP